MDEKYTDLAVRLQAVDSRTRSNEHRIDDHDAEIKNLREEQKALLTIANSVDKIAASMLDIKEDIKHIKSDQSQLTEKVTILENRPAAESKRRWDGIADRLLWLVIGGAAAYILSFATGISF